MKVAVLQPVASANKLQAGSFLVFLVAKYNYIQFVGKGLGLNFLFVSAWCLWFLLCIDVKCLLICCVIWSH